jgi:hypothetical protein
MAPVQELVRRHRRQELQALALSQSGGYLPPVGTHGGPVLLPVTRPLWKVSARGAPAGTAAAAARRGFAPALLCDSLDELSWQEYGAPVPFCMVQDGPAPGRTDRAVAAGLLAPHSAVFLHVDLRRMHWRTAAATLPAAFLSAAWQGLAGVAVTGPAPSANVQRQRALWHVLRDARRDAATWQGAYRRAGVLLESQAPGTVDRARLARVHLAAAIGTHEAAKMRVERHRRSFREVYGPTTGASAAEAADALDGARRVAEGAWRALAELPLPTAENLYWQGRPMLRDGEVCWALVAAGGEAQWKAALSLQDEIKERTAHEVSLSRALPDELDELDMLWILADRETPDALPPAVHNALQQQPDREPVHVALPQGPELLILTDMTLLHALAAGLHRSPTPYAPAHNVK